MEDNALKYRWLLKMTKNGDDMIDYSEFFSMLSKDIVLLWHGDKKSFLINTKHGMHMKILVI